MRAIDADAMLAELKPITYEMEHTSVLISDMSKIMRNWVERQPTLDHAERSADFVATVGDGRRSRMKITLKAARVNVGLNQKEAAAQLCVSISTLSNWERGVTFPRANEIDRIKEAYMLDRGTDIKWETDME